MRFQPLQVMRTGMNGRDVGPPIRQSNQSFFLNTQALLDAETIIHRFFILYILHQIYSVTNYQLSGYGKAYPKLYQTRSLRHRKAICFRKRIHMSEIFYLDAAAGTGKTYNMARRVASYVKVGSSFIIVMPTKKMADDIESELIKVDWSITVKKFHTDTVEGSVVSSIMRYLNEPLEEAHVVVMTAPAFGLLRYFNNPGRWYIILDEVPSVFELFERTLPNNHSVFTDCVDPYSIGPDLGYSYLDVIDETKLRNLRENTAHDDVDKIYQPLADRVLSDEYEVYVQNQNYKGLLAGENGEKKMLLFAVRRPKLLLRFKACLIMAAQFKETLLYKIWSRMGVTFIEEEDFKSDLNQTTHQNGCQVTFYYGYDQNWSKTTKDDKANKLTENLIEAALKVLDGKECLLLRNNGCEKSTHLLELDAFRSLPGKSHGQNQFKGYNNVLVLAAFNPSPPAIKFLKIMYGIDNTSTKRGIMGYEIYQAVMRSSLRDRSNVSPKIIIVPDKATAEWLSSLFPGSSCRSLSLDQPTPKRRGPKAVHVSSIERQRASREKIKAERLGFLKEIELATQGNLRDFCQNERDEFTLKSIGNNVSLFRGTIIKNIRKINFEKSLYVGDEGPFIAELRRRAKIRLANKQDNEAISPACFRPLEDCESVTGAINVWFANGIWLDLDNTDLKPSALSKILSGIKFVAYNTYSHRKGCFRYRCWIPTSSIMSNQQYRNIVRQIVKKVESTGVYIDKTDPSNMNKKVHGIEHRWDASNKFYLPCKPGDGSAGFLTVFDEEGRLPLDVDKWLESSAVSYEESLPTGPIIVPDKVENSTLTPLQAYIVEDALARFKEAPKGSGHVMYYKLHLRLIHNGIRGTHWLTIMSQAAGDAKSPSKRYRELEIYRRQGW